MNNNNENKLIPRLRFPEFISKGNWYYDIFENLISTITPPKKLNSSEYLKSGKYPIVDQSENLYCGWTNDIDALINKNLPLIIFGDHTCIFKIVHEPFAQGADGIKIIKPNDALNTEYLYHYLNFNKVKQEGYKRHYSILKKKFVLFPEIKTGEQQKIASCLSSLDEVITAERQKLELLKAHKKGLLQNLFPQEGETVPKFRLPEFKDSGEWEYNYGNELFEQIVNKKHNSNLPILAITQEYGAVPRETIDYFISVTDASIQSYKVVEIGDFIISLRSFQGGIEFSRYKGLCSPAYIILRNKVDLVKDFYRHYFKTSRFIKDLNKNIEGIRDGKMVSYKQFSEILIPAPSLPEQQKIADCLSSLDDLIQAQEQKIELLEQHKKGLLQGLFPNLKQLDNEQNN